MADLVNRMNDSDSAQHAQTDVAVSLEALLYVVLGAFALVMRLAQLNAVPLTDVEAHEALAAWHFVMPNAQGAAPLAANPIMFMFNSMMLAVAGGSEIIVRLSTAIAGTALILTPILWRRELGRAAALATTMVLVISPAMFISSRTMAPVVWSMLLAILGLWCGWQFVQYRTNNHAYAATALFAGVLLVADPAGWVLLAILGLAWLWAVRASRDEAPDDQPAPRLMDALQGWPWAAALLIAVMSVILIATAAMFFPMGLAQIGQLLGNGLRNAFERPAYTPFAFPLLIFLLYEPVLWVLGLVGLFPMFSRDDFISRFMTGWSITAIFAMVLYQGAGPAYALWLVVPLAVLGGRVLAQVIRPIEDVMWRVPRWVVPLLATTVLAILLMAATNFLYWVAFYLRTPGLALSNQGLRLVFVAMFVILLGIVYFLAGSLWGTRAAWNGYILGVALVLGLYGISAGWRVAVTNASSPVELWHTAPVDDGITRIREVLNHAAVRDTGGAYETEIVVQAPDDGIIAWLLRDYGQVDYVPLIDSQVNAPVVIAPVAFQPEALGAKYVGQDFPVTRAWNVNALQWRDVPDWIMFGDASYDAWVDDTYVIWLREDIYGLPPETSDLSEEN